MKYLILVLLPSFIFASENEQAYDFLPRLINFAIFTLLLYFLLFKVAKKAHQDRISAISKRFATLEKKVKESKHNKENIKVKIEESKSSASKLLEEAKKDALLIKEQIAEESKEILNSIKISYANKKLYEERKISLQVANEVLDELFSETSLDLNKNDILNIIKKKVE